MKKEYLKNKWHKLDNTAKIFSLDDKHNTNIFRYSVILKENIDKNILFDAVKKSLDLYPEYKVKIGSGLFWNYLEYNSKEIKIDKEDEIPCQRINFKRNNDYLFKITYFKRKINLDVFHMLTDGTGAMFFLKAIIYNYLSQKHNKKLNIIRNSALSYQDQYLKNYNKDIVYERNTKIAYQIPGRVKRNTNNTYHYILNIKDIKRACKKLKVTITEFLTTIYIYSLYLSFYKKKTKKDIVITVPINIRKHFGVDTLSNFFVTMNVHANLNNQKPKKFEEMLKQVRKEFKENLTFEKVKSYITRDVKLGTNIFIRLAPLPIKKLFIKCAGTLVNKTITSTLSNVGVIDIDAEYKEYIDNILVLVIPNRNQKVKCTICSFEQKLNVTINSNINHKKFEQTFLCVLKNYVNNIKLETNLR